MKPTTIYGMLAASVVLLAAVGSQAAAQGTSTTEISGAGSRTQETTAGNLVADAVRAAANADVAIVAADALTGATVSRGAVSQGDLKSLLTDPEDEVATLALTGAQLKVVLERSVSAHPKPFDGFLQVSGLTLTFNNDRPAQSRVTDVRVNGAALEPNRRYRVATMATLAGGGLGYFRIWDQKDVTGGGPNVLDALVGYVRAEREVSPRVEGRIKPA